MESILQKEFNKLHRSGGKPPKLSVRNKLWITLKYLREYRTRESIAHDYSVCKSTVCETIQWVAHFHRTDHDAAMAINAFVFQYMSNRS
jgi:hypothetical protein